MNEMDLTHISGLTIRRVGLCTKRGGLLLGRARMLEFDGNRGLTGGQKQFLRPQRVPIGALAQGNDMRRLLRGIAVAAMLGFGVISFMGAAAHAEPGVFDNRIVFGQSAAFEGSAAALGLGMREGILAAFNEANATGGVTGRRLELVSYDDGYEPEKAIANTKRLID
jgi:Periplasmic binding protein